jgi:hypothetical protein
MSRFIMALITIIVAKDRAPWDLWKGRRALNFE